MPDAAILYMGSQERISTLSKFIHYEAVPKPELSNIPVQGMQMVQFVEL
jgi:hypothetical protein